MDDGRYYLVEKSSKEFLKKSLEECLEKELVETLEIFLEKLLMESLEVFLKEFLKHYLIGLKMAFAVKSFYLSAIKCHFT